jgi:hypothetical protein
VQPTPRRTVRRLLVPLVALAVALPVTLGATGATAATRSGSPTAVTRVPAPPTGATRAARPVTRSQALAVLAKAERQLRPHATSPGARSAAGGRKVDLTMTLRDLASARGALSGADRAAADRILARPTNGAGGDPVKYGGAHYRYHCFAGTVFCIHWVTTGANAISATDSDHDGIPNYVEYVITTMNYVYAYETSTLGYRKPLYDTATAGRYRGNPNAKYDIYLAELGSLGLYGYCAPEGSETRTQLPGYCVLDNNYAPSQYGSASILSPMRVTAAHEFFHDVQFAYDVWEDTWFMEGTATWVEDEVFDAIDDNLQYLPYSPIRYATVPADYQTDLHRYGAWIFFRYASESLGDRSVVRRMWEAADAGAGSLYSLQAIRKAVEATPRAWPDFFATFGLWNLLSTGTYSERASYPAPSYVLSTTLTPTNRFTRLSRYPVLRHLSSAAFRVGASPSLPAGQRLHVSVDGPATVRGSYAVVQTRFRDGTLDNQPLALSTAGNAVTDTAFDPATVSSVVVLVANTSTAMTGCGTVVGGDGYEAFTCGGRGVYDSNDPFVVHLSLVP